MRDPQIGRWRKPEAGEEYLRLYDELVREVFSTTKSLDMPTRFGSTRVYSRNGSGPAVLLLPGAGAPALMWAPVIDKLDGPCIYTVDLIGDVGRSVQQELIPDRDALLAWLDDVLNALEIESIHLVGASYGGWIALAYAQHAPDRVATLTLVEPVIEPLRKMFWVHGIAAGLTLLLPMRLRRIAAARLHLGVLATDDKRIRRLGFLGQARLLRGTPPFVPVTDDELATLRTPTRVLLGAHSSVHHTKQLASRLRHAIPKARVEVIADAGHALPTDQADAVVAVLRDTLGDSPD